MYMYGMRGPIEGRAREGLGLVGTVLLTLRLFLVLVFTAHPICDETIPFSNLSFFFSSLLH